MSDHFGSISIQPATTKPAPPSRPGRPERPAQKRPVRPRKHRTEPRIPKSLLFAFLLFFIAGSYLVIGLWGIPKYISTSLPDSFSQRTGMALRLGRVEFNPFSFALKISDISVIENSDTAVPLFSLQSFATDIAPLSLLQGEVIAKRLVLDTFQLNLIRNGEGDYNYYVPAPGGTKTSPTAFLDFSNLPFRFSFNNISLANGGITFHDNPNNNTHIIKEIQLTLPNLSNFSFQAKEYIHPSFSAIVNGSPIQLTGQAALTGNSKDTDAGLRTELSCNFNAIDLSKYFNYLPFGLPFDVTEGKAEGSLRLTFAQSDTDDMLSVDFSMQASEMALRSSDESFKLRIPSAKLEGSIQPLTGNTHLKSIELRDPTTSISEKFSFSQFKAFASLTIAKDGANTSQNGGPEVKIDLLQADNGTIILSGDDPKANRDSWKDLQLTLKNYTNTIAGSAAGKQATFRLSGRQENSKATLNWQGYLDEHLLPAGDLQLGEFSAAKLFTLLGLSDTQVKKGSVDVQGHLSFKDYPDLDLNSRITLAEGTLTFTDLTLIENTHVWYSAPATKFTGFSKDAKKIALGSVYLKNSTMHLFTDNLPTMVKKFGAAKRSIGIEALDFSGTLTLADSRKKLPELQFDKVSLQAINLSRLESSSERDNLTLTASLGKSGDIQAKGKVRLNPFVTSLTTGFSGITGSQLLPWLGDSGLIADAATQLAGKGTFSFPYVSFNGQLLLRNGTLSRKNTPYFTWKEIHLNDFRYNSDPLHLGASRCDIVEPKISWTYTKDSPHLITALSGFLQKHFQPNGKKENDTGKLPSLEVQSVNISTASIQLKDNRLTPSWSGNIEGLRGSIEKVSSDPAAENSSYTLSGMIESVPFSLAGTIHLFNLNKNGSSDFTLNNFPLSSYRQPLAKQLDMDASKAEVSVASKSSWGNGLLNQDATLELRNITPRSAKAESALTLALMTDAENRFTLPVHTEQKLDQSPSPLVNEAMAAFQKLMLKAAVSPLLVAGGDFSDLIGEEHAEFHPGQILLTDKGQQSIARFSSLLSTHPNIRLTVTGSADAAIDEEAMRKDLEEAEQQRVIAENLRRNVDLEKAIAEYIRQANDKLKATGKNGTIVEQKIPPELYKRYAPIKPQKVDIDKAMLRNLATERARVIVEFFTKQLSIAPERVSTAKKPVIHNEKEVQGNRVLFTVGTYAAP